MKLFKLAQKRNQHRRYNPIYTGWSFFRDKLALALHKMQKFPGILGSGGRVDEWHCSYSYKLQGPGEILKVNFELNLTLELEIV